MEKNLQSGYKICRCELSNLASAKSSIYQAISWNDPSAAFAAATEIHSAHLAKHHVENLLGSINDFWGGSRQLLDKVVASLIVNFNLISSQCSFNDTTLVSWLDSSHCGTNQRPLCDVITLLVECVRRDDEGHRRSVNRCISSVVTHLVLKEVDPTRVLQSLRPNYSVLCLLLKLRMTEDDQMLRLVRFPEKCFCSRELIETVAELHPSTGSIVYKEFAWQCFYKHTTQLFGCCNEAETFARPETLKDIECWLDLLRTWLEVGIALELPGPYKLKRSHENPLFFVLHHLVKFQGRNFRGFARVCIQLALWLSSANPHFVYMLLCKHGKKPHLKQLGLHLPLFAEAIVYHVHSLQLLCANVVRRHLCQPILVSTHLLPLPTGVKRYVTHAFLDLNPSTVDSIVSEVCEWKGQ